LIVIRPIVADASRSNRLSFVALSLWTYTLDMREDLFADAISRTKWRKPESANG
jgi:hypothetical protein